jgi:hypothetical protein
MKFLKGVLKFINSKIFGYILIAVIAILLVGTCGRNSSIKEEVKRKDQNISALNDSLKIERLKNGDLQVSKNAYMADAKELRSYNIELSDVVKAQKGEVVTLNRIIFQLKQDSIELQKAYNELKSKFDEPEQVNDSTWNVDWLLTYVYDSTNFDIFDGRTQVGIRGAGDYFKDITLTHNKTWMLNRQSQIGLIWGQKYDKDGKLKVFAQTAHPAFKAQLLEGTYVDYSKKSHWFTGFGIGPELSVGYDFLHNQPAVMIGVGIHYSIYNW